jgi:predicted metal-binding protein
MQIETQHTLFVCTTCASVWKDGKRVGESGGEKLFQELTQLHQDWQLHEEFSLQPVECMSACNRACVVSFAAGGKYTYLFGDLSSDSSTDKIATVLECASKYYNHPQGLLPWAERPEALKKGILARIPALAVPTTQLSRPNAGVTV